MQASAKSATVSTAKAKPARKTKARKAPVTPRTRKATATPQPQTPKVEKVETSNPTKSIFDFKDLTELRGLDFVVLPLIFLEAFTVNILQNAGFTVPPRVAIK
tara:strand:+ start:86 stop:394 length:309 start_codon:yes stop_codon:yes gene_type:complete